LLRYPDTIRPSGVIGPEQSDPVGLVPVKIIPYIYRMGHKEVQLNLFFFRFTISLHGINLVIIYFAEP
jgi:hypothetical protein